MSAVTYTVRPRLFRGSVPVGDHKNMQRSQRMAWLTVALIPAVLAGTLLRPTAKRGPFSPEAWPPTIDATKKVHFVSIDGAFSPPNDNWTANLAILTGGDHPT